MYLASFLNVEVSSLKLCQSNQAIFGGLLGLRPTRLSVSPLQVVPTPGPSRSPYASGDTVSRWDIYGPMAAS